MTCGLIPVNAIIDMITLARGFAISSMRRMSAGVGFGSLAIVLEALALLRRIFILKSTRLWFTHDLTAFMMHSMYPGLYSHSSIHSTKSIRVFSAFRGSVFPSSANSLGVMLILRQKRLSLRSMLIAVFTLERRMFSYQRLTSLSLRSSLARMFSGVSFMIPRLDPRLKDPMS